MAALNVVLNGTFTVNDTTAPGTFQGTMAYSDRGVGGGPVFPPSDAHPEHPIVIPKPPGGEHPEHPIYYPPHPAHPIVLPPDPPTEPPVDPPTNPADPKWVWGYVPSIQAWQPVYVPGEGEAGPKAGR